MQSIFVNIVQRRRNRLVLHLFLILLLFIPITTNAQCTIENRAFNAGETLNYDLYYNWHFFWVKAGTAEMNTIKTKYNGKDAYRSHLITRGNNKLDDYFVLRDTLLCYTGLDISPMYFRKGAREGKRYTVDEVFYDFSGGKCNVKQHFINKDGEHRFHYNNSEECIFDMISMLMRARSFSPVGWKEGHTVLFKMADGDDIYDCKLLYRGKEKYKVKETKEQFDCLVLSFMEKEDGKFKEIVRFYVTDDDNHLPVRLDMFLRFGSAKAFLNSYKNIRHPLTSKISK